MKNPRDLTFSKLLSKKYKVSELQTICENFNIPVSSKLKKQEIIDKIVQRFHNHPDEMIESNLDEDLIEMVCTMIVSGHNSSGFLKNQLTSYFVYENNYGLMVPKEVIEAFKSYFEKHDISVIKFLVKRGYQFENGVINENLHYQLPKTSRHINGIAETLKIDEVAKKEYIQWLEQQKNLSPEGMFLLKGLIGEYQNFEDYLRFVKVPDFPLNEEEAMDTMVKKMYFFGGLAEMYGIVPISIVVKLYNQFFQTTYTEREWIVAFEEAIEKSDIAFLTVTDLVHSMLKDDYYQDEDYIDYDWEDDSSVYEDDDVNFYFEVEEARAQIEYYLPKTLQEVVHLGKYQYENTPELISLLQQLKSYCTRDAHYKAVDTIDTVVFSLRTDLNQDRIQSFAKSLIIAKDFEGISEDALIILLTEIKSHLHLWKYRGHTKASFKQHNN